MITINYQRFGSKTFQLRLRLYQDGETKFINVTKLLKGDIQKRHWNPKKQLFIPSCPFSDENNDILVKFRQKYLNAALNWTGSVYGLLESLEESPQNKIPTISDFIKNMAKVARGRLHADGTEKGTYENYLKLDKRLNEYCVYKKNKYENILITELSPKFIDGLFHWIHTVKNGKGKSYISKDLHTVVSYADMEGYLKMEDYKKCDWYKKPKASTMKYYTLSEEQCNKFLGLNFDSVINSKLNKLYRDVCVFMLYTGQSPCDTLTLRKDDIQVIDGVKHLVFKRRKIAHKQSVPCTVPVGKELQAIIDYWLPKSKDGYIFPVRNKRKLATQVTLNGDIKHFVGRCNTWLKKVATILECNFSLHTYTFRHTAITRYVSKNVPVVYISNMVGTSVDNIEKIYYNNQGDISSRNLVMAAMT